MEFIHRLISFLLLFVIIPMHILLAVLRLPLNFLCWLHWQNFWKFDLLQPPPGQPNSGTMPFEKLRYNLATEILIRFLLAIYNTYKYFIAELSIIKTTKI